jgi:hypothetical protein
MFGLEAEDRIGKLQDILERLAAGGVDLCCFYAASAAGRGVLYIGPKTPAMLDAAANAIDLKFKEVAGLMIEDDDEVGAGAAVLKILADAGVNCLAAGAKICDGRYHLGIVVAAEDGDIAENALRDFDMVGDI